MYTLHTTEIVLFHNSFSLVQRSEQTIWEHTGKFLKFTFLHYLMQKDPRPCALFTVNQSTEGGNKGGMGIKSATLIWTRHSLCEWTFHALEEDNEVKR